MAAYVFREHGAINLNLPPQGRDANVIGSRLAELRNEQPELTPRIIVDDARPDDAVLHDYFEWRDDIAGEKWRVEQARSMARSVMVVIEEETTREPIRTRAFVGVMNESRTEHRFEPIATVLNDKALYAQICRRALADLDSFRERYSQFTSLKQIASSAHSAVQLELESAINDTVSV